MTRVIIPIFESIEARDNLLGLLPNDNGESHVKFLVSDCDGENFRMPRVSNISIVILQSWRFQ